MKAIQNVKNGVAWNSPRSLKFTWNSVIWQSAYKFLLAFHSDYVPILHRFWDTAKDL